MTFKEQVNQLLTDALAERPHLFLVQLKISPSNSISVTIDGDNGVNLQDCIEISRAIEHNLDRETCDFALEVTSAGVSSPLILVRQYKKNKGRELKVKTLSGEVIEAVLADVSDSNITLKWTAREPKEIGKGKITVEKTKNLRYEEIKEATVILSF